MLTYALCFGIIVCISLLIGGRMLRLNNVKLTWEAIDAVRGELAEAARAGDNIKAHEILLRLSELYASIDAKEFVATLNELEKSDNVVIVDFKQRARKVG